MIPWAYCRTYLFLQTLLKFLLQKLFCSSCIFKFYLKAELFGGVLLDFYELDSLLVLTGEK